MMKSGSQGAKEVSLHFFYQGSLLGCYFHPQEQVSTSDVKPKHHFESLPFQFFDQGKKWFGENVTDPHVVQLVDHVRFSLLVKR
jgi:hypothetical protein